MAFDDTLVLPFGHLAVTGEPHTDVLREVQKAVLQRVRMTNVCAEHEPDAHASD